MRCPACNVDRPESHGFCFDCGASLKDEDQMALLQSTIVFADSMAPGSLCQQLKKLADFYPENAFTQKMLGDALLKRGKLVEAKARYRAALDLNPRNIDSLYDFCIVLYYQARLSETLTLLKEILEVAPDFSAAHYRIGLTYYHLGQFDEAIYHLRKCVELTPEYEMAHYHLGVVFAKKGEADNAIVEFGNHLNHELRDTATRLHLVDLFIKKRESKKQEV